MNPPLFLDLDGPLLDVSRRHFELHADIARAFGLPVTLDLKGYWEIRRAGVSGVGALARAGLSTDDLPAVRDLWMEMIEDEARMTADVPQPGALDALKRLAQGRPIILVTLRQHRERMLNQIDRLRMAEHLSLALSASPLAPSPPAIKASLIRSSIGASTDSWIAGDTEIDIKAGRIAGCRTAALSCGIRSPDALSIERPDLLVADLASFAEWLIKS